MKHVIFNQVMDVGKSLAGKKALLSKIEKAIDDEKPFQCCFVKENCTIAINIAVEKEVIK